MAEFITETRVADFKGYPVTVEDFNEPIIRCGYCKWYREGTKTNYCDKLRRITGADGFCAWAEEAR